MPELFIEIRHEELPARFIDGAMDELKKAVTGLLKGIAHGEVRTWATPRRTALSVADVAVGKAVEEQLVTGPPEAAAFRDGVPTKVAEGFARGRGVAVEELEIVDGPKGRVIAARIKSGGEQTVDLVAAGLEAAVLAMSFPKSMRWGAGGPRWGRPIHNVVAVFDGVVVPATVAGLPTSDTTWGHRMCRDPEKVTGAESWLKAMKDHMVLADPEERRAELVRQLSEAAAGLGCELADLPDLVHEVAHLVEWPVVVVGTFDEALLELPPRLLEETMIVNQRYFPLYKGGKLDRHFLITANNPFGDPGIIAAGNAKVIAARFDDARFFNAEDHGRRLEDHGTGLQRMRWVRNGGTMAEKAERVSALARQLAPLFGADTDKAGRAAALCKADLCTHMVGEFPSLQGHVGRLLAEHDGEDATVALAIEEHYHPRYSGDSLPTTAEGLCVAAADRIDTLRRCFELGLQPKGSGDPLGLRRAANGLVALVVEAGIDVSLGELLGDDLGLVSFVMERNRSALQERFATDLVKAVTAVGDANPYAQALRCRALAAVAEKPEWEPLRTTFKRAMGLIKDHEGRAYAADGLTEPAEISLHEAIQAVSGQAAEQAGRHDWTGAIRTLARLRQPIDRLFDEVMVMAEDPDVRANRLGLLVVVRTEFSKVADFTQFSS